MAKPQESREFAWPSGQVEIRAELVRKIASHTHHPSLEGALDTAIPGLSLFRRSRPSSCTSATYMPSLIVFAQGRKRINVGRSVLHCDQSNFLLTSIDLPVVSQITGASPESPMLGLTLKLEMPEIRRILSEEFFPIAKESPDPRGMSVGTSSAELLGACSRLLDLLDSPQDIPFLGSLIQREIIYRLLRSDQGKHLRAIATLGESSHRTAGAVAWLRVNFAKQLRVDELAALAHMGVSTFHHHFRSLTSMSPLQYQKQLRLHMARERMLNEGLDAATAAFEVGYESASQFNREYRRFFGQPPLRDVKTLRHAMAAPAI